MSSFSLINWALNGIERNNMVPSDQVEKLPNTQNATRSEDTFRGDRGEHSAIAVPLQFLDHF